GAGGPGGLDRSVLAIKVPAGIPMLNVLGHAIERQPRNRDQAIELLHHLRPSKDRQRRKVGFCKGRQIPSGQPGPPERRTIGRPKEQVAQPLLSLSGETVRVPAETPGALEVAVLQLRPLTPQGTVVIGPWHV